jgi:O-antigen/teichoic acid export membrane protein
MSRTSRAVKGTIASVLQYGVQIATQILLAPLVLRIAGQETLGAYSILMQAIGYLALVDLGFSIAVGRGLAQSLGLSDNGRTFIDTFTTGRTFALASNGTFSLLIIVLSFAVQRLLGLTAGVAAQAQYGLWALAIWAVVRTPMSLYGNALSATQNLAATNYIGIVGNFVRLALSLILIILRVGLFGLVLANICAELVTYLGQRLWFERRYPDWRFGWGLPDRKLFVSLFRYGIQAMLIQVATQMILRSDSIALGYLSGAVAVSIYYTTQMPTVIGYNIINRLSENAFPAINEMYGLGDKERLRDIFIRLSRYTWILVALMLIGFMFFNRLVVSLWVGSGQYAGDSVNTALVLFAVMVSAGQVGKTFVMAMGRIRVLSFLSLGEGILHLALALWLGHIWGLAGVAWGGAIANIPTFIYLQWEGLHRVDVSGSFFAKQVLFPTLIPSAILVLFQFGWKIVIFNTKWYIILINLILMILIYCIAIYLFSITPMEKSKLSASFFKVRSHIKLGL